MDCNSSPKIFVVRHTHTLHTYTNQPLPHRPAQPSPAWQAQDPQASSWTSDLHALQLQGRLCLSAVLDTCWHGSLTEKLLVLLLTLHVRYPACTLNMAQGQSLWFLIWGQLAAVTRVFVICCSLVPDVLHNCKACISYVTIFFLLLLCFSAHISIILVINGQILSKSPLPEPSGRLCTSSCNVFLCCVKACSELNFLGDKLSIIALCFCNWLSNFICAF